MLVGQGALARRRRGRPGRRDARRRRRQGAAREGRAAGRPALVTGSIGLLGTKPSWDLMTGCDTLLMVGSSFPYSEFLPKEGKARGVQIDLDGRMVEHPLPDGGQPGRRRQATLRALLPKLERKEDRSWRERSSEGVHDWWELMERARPPRSGPGQSPARLPELSQRLPEGAILTADSGSAANWYARDIKPAQGDDGIALGHARDDGPGHAVRDRREVRAPGSPCVRPRRRRRDPDERDGRADHGRQVLGALERPALRRPRAAQRRPQPGHLGAARDGGRPEVRGLAGAARLPVRALRGAARLQGHPRRRSRRGRLRLGRGARGRPARARRGDHRPRGAAAAAAHHARGGAALHALAAARPRSRRGDQGVVQAEDRRADPGR